LEVTPKCNKTHETSLTKKEVQLIEKLSERHQVERNRASKEVLKKLSTISDDEDLVFTAKVKYPKTEMGQKHFRGSEYRGVSANGKSWQVFIVISKDKCYAGCRAISTDAGRLYDILSITFHGLKVSFHIFIQ